MNDERRISNAKTKIRFAGLLYALLLWTFLADASNAADAPAVAPENHPLDLSAFRLKSVWECDLSKPQKIVREEDLIEVKADGTLHRKAVPDGDVQWIAEGTGGCIAGDGKLWVSPTPFDANGNPGPGARSHMVIFNRQPLPADFLLEFDVSPCGSTNGLLMVFLCAAGKNGEDVCDLKLPARRAIYDAYLRGELDNYSDSYWSRNKVPAGESESNRLRKNPGAELVSQGQSLTTGPTDVTHHLRILKVGGRIQIEVNGKIVNDWTDPGKPLNGGCFGLRSMEGITKVAYSNFKISQVSAQTPATASTAILQDGQSGFDNGAFLLPDLHAIRLNALLRPEKRYEGLNLPKQKPHVGESTGPGNAMPHPAVFTDTDGRGCLLNPVEGGSAIGIAERRARLSREL